MSNAHTNTRTDIHSQHRKFHSRFLRFLRLQMITLKENLHHMYKHTTLESTITTWENNCGKLFCTKTKSTKEVKLLKTEPIQSECVEQRTVCCCWCFVVVVVAAASAAAANGVLLVVNLSIYQNWFLFSVFALSLSFRLKFSMASIDRPQW